MESKELDRNIETTVSTVPDEINSIDDMKVVTDKLSAINMLIKEVRKCFDPLVKKANDAHKALTKERCDRLSPLEEKKVVINNMIVEFNQREAKKQVAQATETDDMFDSIIASTPGDIPTPRGMYFKESWTAKVVDIEKVPREYLVPDMVKLNGVARTFKNDAKIDGVEFICTQTPVQRS